MDEYKVKMVELYYKRNFKTRFKREMTEKSKLEVTFTANSITELSEKIITESKFKLRKDLDLIAVHSLIKENGFEFYIDRPYLNIV